MVFAVSSCPRCVRPVPQQATRCPNCGYDLAAAERSAPYPAPRQAELRPWAPLTRPGGIAAATPTEATGLIGHEPDQGSSLIPGFTDGPQGTGPPDGGRRYWWGVGGAIVAALAVITVIAVLAASRIGHRGAAPSTPVTPAATPTGGTSPSAAPSSSPSASTSTSTSTSAADRQRGQAQASTVAGYLTQSGQARQGISAAISAIGSCRDIPSAVTALHNAAAVRSHIVTSLASTDVSALPGGAAAVADLSRAMQASADADMHYAAWGQAVTGCHGHAPQNAELAAAHRSDTAATAAKQRFADEWNPIAATYGLAHQTANTI